MDKTLRAALKKSSIEGKGAWHLLKRTFAVHLLMSGADLESVRQLLGHSDIQTTRAYLNVTGQHLDKSVDRLEFRKEETGVLPFKKA